MIFSHQLRHISLVPLTSSGRVQTLKAINLASLRFITKLFGFILFPAYAASPDL